MSRGPVERRTVAARLPEEVPGLLRFARTLTRDPGRAEDLVQDTVERALARADGFRGDASLTTWLHRILHNLAVDAARRDREEPTDHLAEEVEALWRDDGYTVDPGRTVERAEQLGALREALVHLPFHYRAAVVLHDAEGMTVRQIATVQQISLPAAKQRLRRGRMMLVSKLGGDPPGREGDPVPLRCWEARRHISDYLDRDLDDALVRVVEQHLQGCPTCPPLYAALVGVTHALRSGSRDPDTVVPPDLAQRLDARGAGGS